MARFTEQVPLATRHRTSWAAAFIAFNSWPDQAACRSPQWEAATSRADVMVAPKASFRYYSVILQGASICRSLVMPGLCY